MYNNACFKGGFYIKELVSLGLCQHPGKEFLGTSGNHETASASFPHVETTQVIEIQDTLERENQLFDFVQLLPGFQLSNTVVSLLLAYLRGSVYNK